MRIGVDGDSNNEATPFSKSEPRALEATSILFGSFPKLAADSYGSSNLL